MDVTLLADRLDLLSSKAERLADPLDREAALLVAEETRELLAFAEIPAWREVLRLKLRRLEELVTGPSIFPADE